MATPSSQGTILNRLRHVNSSDGQTQANIPPSLGTWYECEDIFSIIPRLEEIEQDVDKGLQIVGLEGGYGVGKSFVVNKVFNRNNYNLGTDHFQASKRLSQSIGTRIVVTVEANVFETAEDSVFKEIFGVVKKLLEIAPAPRGTGKKPTNEEIVREVFYRGLKHFEKYNPELSEQDKRYSYPEVEKLFLLNESLGTRFDAKQQKSMCRVFYRFLLDDLFCSRYARNEK